MLISTEFPPGPGGIGTHACQLACKLTELGVEVAVLTHQDNVTVEQALAFNAKQQFRVVRIPRLPAAALSAVARLALAFRLKTSFKPDVLLASGSGAVLASALLGACGGPPWVAVAHGSEFSTRAALRDKLVRRAFSLADAVVAVSVYTKNRMGAVGIGHRNSIVIHNGADAGLFQVLPTHEVTAAKRRLALQDQRVILTIGNVTRRKGQEIVIRALPLILQKVPNIIYLMVGLPTERARLERIAAELGILDCLRFLGVVEPRLLVLLLNCADVFVMTSISTEDGDCEGFGIAAMEAALCGKPAVVSLEGGLVEAVLDQYTGLCVPARDSRAVADAVTSLLTNEDLRSRLGTAARARALREYTWDEVAHRCYEVLKGVCATGSRT